MGPRRPDTTHNPDQGRFHAGRPHGHAPLQRERDRPVRSAETRTTSAHVGMVCQRLLCNSQQKVRKAPDAAVRVNWSVQKGLPGAGKVTIRPPGTGPTTGTNHPEARGWGLMPGRAHRTHPDPQCLDKGTDSRLVPTSDGPGEGSEALLPYSLRWTS